MGHNEIRGINSEETNLNQIVAPVKLNLNRYSSRATTKLSRSLLISLSLSLCSNLFSCFFPRSFSHSLDFSETISIIASPFRQKKSVPLVFVIIYVIHFLLIPDAY